MLALTQRLIPGYRCLATAVLDIIKLLDVLDDVMLITHMQDLVGPATTVSRCAKPSAAARLFIIFLHQTNFSTKRLPVAHP